LLVTKTYHHGDLRDAVLAAAAEVIARDGVEQLSLRSVAAELGVSHTAPRHHFGSREGVFTALATQGYRGLAEAIDAVSAVGGSFAEVGAAYVEFAVSHPGHFAVMFRPDLVDGDDPDLAAATERTSSQLRTGASAATGSTPAEVTPAEVTLAATAAWSLVHGLATLLLSGAVDRDELTHVTGGDLHEVVVRTAELLFRPPATPPANPAKDSPQHDQLIGAHHEPVHE
jgi:AcrR family transcriptional regulator